MTADDAREELEAAIWGTDPASLGAVRAVLAAADRYAELGSRRAHRGPAYSTAPAAPSAWPPPSLT